MTPHPSMRKEGVVPTRPGVVNGRREALLIAAHSRSLIQPAVGWAWTPARRPWIGFRLRRPGYWRPLPQTLSDGLTAGFLGYRILKREQTRSVVAGLHGRCLISHDHFAAPLMRVRGLRPANAGRPREDDRARPTRSPRSAFARLATASRPWLTPPVPPISTRPRHPIIIPHPPGAAPGGRSMASYNPPFRSFVLACK